MIQRKRVSFIIDIPVYEADDEKAYARAEAILGDIHQIDVVSRYPSVQNEEVDEDAEYSHKDNFQYWPDDQSFTNVKPSDYNQDLYIQFIRDMRRSGVPCYAAELKNYAGPAVKVTGALKPYMVYMSSTSELCMVDDVMYPVS